MQNAFKIPMSEFRRRVEFLNDVAADDGTPHAEADRQRRRWMKQQAKKKR